NLDKRYTDIKQQSKLDRKELILLNSLHESQRRVNFLEKSLRQSEETIAELKEHQKQSQEVLEQELIGLERENEDLREIYRELQQVVRQSASHSSNQLDGDNGVAAASVG